MIVKAKIYQPAKTSMQSGRRKTKRWLLEYGADVPNAPEPLMGWNSGGTLQQICIEFDTKESAVAYAEKNLIPFELLDPKSTTLKPRSYAANFAWDKRTAF
ncbi:MAG: ETC complex I subunit [Rickettsiales bacterium]|nr:ETC complex I subunit [Rickettsiales bacterium]